MLKTVISVYLFNNQSRFFDKFSLSIIAVDILGNIIFEHKNINQKHISPNTLYILVHNNHCYKLNCNESSFIKDLNSLSQKDETISARNPPNKFPFVDFEKTRNMKFVYIYNLDDVVEHIKNNEAGVTIRFITENSLVRMLFEMIKRQYIPDVNYENKKN